MKFCKRCNTLKSESEFGRLKAAKDGLNYICKECYRKKMQDWIASEENREKANRNAARYRRTKKGKMTGKRYYNSQKGANTREKYTQKKEITKQIKARQAVNHAVEVGKIPKAKTQVCTIGDDSCEGRMEYHHHKGYNKAHWLDVIPLCKKHHCEVDNINYHNNL